MEDLKNQKLKYAHSRVQHLAVELIKIKRIFSENSSSIQDDLISQAIMCLVRCDNLNHTNQNLDQFSMVDGLSTHQISSQL